MSQYVLLQLRISTMFHNQNKDCIMKRTKLLTSVCLAICAFSTQTVAAQSSLPQAFPGTLGMQGRISFIEKTPVRLAETSLTHSFAQPRERMERALCAARQTSFAQAIRPSRVGFKADGQYKQQLDSIVTNIRSTGEGYSRTYFYYYDDTKLPKKAIAQVYVNGEWVTQEQYEYTWDEDGYCLTQSVISPLYNYGEKHEYVYNDQKLGVEQVISQYSDGQWVLTSKGEYAYDERGNMIEEHTYAYDATAQGWVNQSWSKASYDENNFQTHMEGYSWDGTSWQPSVDMQDVKYTPYGYITELVNSKWMADTQQWMNYYKIKQQWNENRLCTVQEVLYYNPEKQDWVGCYDFGWGELQNAIAYIEYDPQTGIMKSDVACGMPKPDHKYVKGVSTYYDIEKLDNGDYRSEGKTYYINGADSIVRDTTVRVLRDAISLPESQRIEKMLYNRYLTMYLYETLKPFDTNEWTPQFEETYDYTSDFKLKSSIYYNYTQDAEHKKIADIREEYIFDDHGNVVDSYYQMGKGTGADDWEYTSRFTYEYENDTVRINKLNYRWVNGEWTPGWGEGNSYDYSVPVDQIVMWTGTKPYHKMTEARRYVAAGKEFDCQVGTYYYSDLGSNGITAAREDQSTPFVLNGRTLNVAGQADGVTLRNSLGQTVLVSTQGSIDLTSIPRGLYVVTVKQDGKTTCGKVIVE